MGLLVEGGPGLHVVRDIRNMDTKLPGAAGGPAEGEGVVEVARGGGVDGDDRVSAAIGAIDDFPLLNGGSEAFCLKEDLARKDLTEGGSRLWTGC